LLNRGIALFEEPALRIEAKKSWLLLHFTTECKHMKAEEIFLRIGQCEALGQSFYAWVLRTKKDEKPKKKFVCHDRRLGLVKFIPSVIKIFPYILGVNIYMLRWSRVMHFSFTQTCSTLRTRTRSLKIFITLSLI
jgi:hypothetical protein